MEDITDADYSHKKRFVKILKQKMRKMIKIMIQSNKLLLADVFESFRDMCHKIYDFDPANFFSAPGLVVNGRKRYKEGNMSLYLSICKN